MGVVFIVLPLALHDYINQTIRKTIDRNVVIKPGSQIYDEWKKPTVPVYLQIRTFNILNHLEVKQGKPPFVVEKGPYSYKETKVKVNISWGNDIVTYNEVSTYVFDPETSCETCDPNKDKFITFNIPLIAITQLIKNLSLPDYFDWKEVFSSFLEDIKDDVFINKTVNETVWGYDDPLFEIYNRFRNDLLNSSIKLLRDLAEKLPVIPTKFALQPNPSYDGVTTVNTGQCNIDEVGQYQQWKGYKTLPYWRSKIANMLNGTDGAIYQPHITKNDELYTFVVQLCRSLHLTYLSDASVRGISALRFHPPKAIFESGNINPNNKGFCNPNCLLSGLLSISACVPFHAPIVASSPHFLNGDPKLLEKVLGLHPEEEKHDTFVYLEPNTGVLLEASKRLQFNIHVEPVDGFSQTSGLTPTPVPIMWVNEHVSIDSKNADKLKRNVLIKLEIIKWVEIGLYILGGLLVLISLILFIRLCCSRKKNTQLKLVAENERDYGSISNTNDLNPSLINASD